MGFIRSVPTSILWVLIYVTNCEANELVKPFECKNGNRVCIDSTGTTFRCQDYGMICCRNKTGDMTLYEAPRGNRCCDGDGIYRFRVQNCTANGVVKREHAKYCPNSDVLYDPKQEICCSSSSGETKPYMYDKMLKCCGANYIEKSKGCSAGEKYDFTKIENNPATHQTNYNRMTQDCSQYAMEKRLKKYNNRWSYKYVFQVARFKYETDGLLFYKVKHSKIFRGNGPKTTADDAQLKVVGLPNCGCFVHLKPRSFFAIMTREKIQNKKLILRGNKNIILPMDPNSALAKLVNL